MNDMTTEYVAAFDAGTTALKGALVNGQGCIVASASSELDLIINGDYREQSPDQWWQAFCSASRHMIEQARQSESEFNVTRIRGIIFSGQMQDIIALNGELNPSAMPFCIRMAEPRNRPSNSPRHIRAVQNVS